MNKPIDLELEEARVEYVDAINKITEKHRMSMYFLEMIFRDIYDQIIKGKEQELINHREAWELAKQNEKKNKKEKEGDK